MGVILLIRICLLSLLTGPDLVLLSLLAEKPLHGYQANTLLEFRKVRDWAGVSRPQVYYSLEKLAARGLICTLQPSEDSSAGPERNIFETAPHGSAALSRSLEDDAWTEQTDRPAFLTWLALSWQCRPGVFQKQLKRRQDFPERQLSQKNRKRSRLFAKKSDTRFTKRFGCWV